MVYVGLVAGLQELGILNGTVLAAAALGSAVLVSYTRSKSDGLGFTAGSGMAAVGIMPREVRLVILSAGLILADLIGANPDNSSCDTCAGALAVPPGVLILFLALGVITVGSIVTVIQRILHVRQQARRQST